MIKMMNMNGALRIAACVIAISFAAPSSVYADADVQLNRDMVKRLIESFPRVKTLAMTQAMAKGADLAKVKSPLEAVMRFAADEDVRLQANDAARDYGFKDFAEWANVARATVAAYVHVKSGSSPGGSEKALEKAIEAIRDAEFLTDKQKQKLEKKARKEFEGGSLAATPENIAVVKALEKDLDAIAKRKS